MGIVPGPRKVSPFHRLFQVFPTCQNATESPGRAEATYRARLVLLASRIALRPYVCNSPAATNVVFGGKGGICDGENVNGILG